MVRIAVKPLNAADYGRIEASLRAELETFPADGSPTAKRAWERTLDKVERINGTGDYAPQWPGGPTLRERKAAMRRRDAKTARTKAKREGLA
jgi:hypothetical protein